MLTDEFYIRECLELAKKGIGKVSPNPLVGCVIVKDGKIISTGHHAAFGKAHAEVNAINNAKEFDLTGATAYINLEPCSIYAKTPPCCDLLIAKKIKRVVCGTKDPNPLINGRGIKKLRDAGIDVKVGVLQNECMELNAKFFKYIKTGLPYVTIKIAQTLDAKISSGKKDKNGITSTGSQKYVHELRSEHDAVLIGSGTVEKDNPFLTVRHVRGNQPFRVVLNSSFDINLKSNILTDEFAAKTILVVSDKAYKLNSGKAEKLITKGVRVYPLKNLKDGIFDLKEVLKLLGGLNISSVLVEGGGKVFTQFISRQLFDSLLIFIAPKIIGKGVPVVYPDLIKNNIGLKLSKYNIELIGEDILFKAKLK